jgi:integrase
MTIKHCLVIIRRLFNVARKWGLYKGENPISKVSMPKVDNLRVRFLSDSELDRLLKTLETWPCRESVDIVRFGLLSGFRLGEILRLKWDAVDFQNGYITHIAPKGGKTVSVPISQELMEILKNREPVSEYVFPGKDGGQRYDFKHPFDRIKKAAGISDFRFHDLRHNFASQLVSQDINLAVVKELLSHKDIQTTMKYAHMAPGAIKEAARQSGRMIIKADVVNLEKAKGGKQ